MKKKLLSLVLAGAMVASTSVSAFAADKEYEIQDSKGKDVEVKVEGNISDNSGVILPSTVTVTVPTSTNFTVDQTGELTSPTMSIRNSGDTPVLVILSEFVDVSGTEQINVVQSETALSNQRKNVTLKITGDKDIILTSENNNGKNGKMYKVDGSEATSEEDRKIGRATKEMPLDLKLTGKGVQSTSGDEAIKDSFKLKLKIKQERQ